MNPLFEERNLVDSDLISEEQIREANLRHDLAMGTDFRPALRSTWSEAKLLRRGLLTDKKITLYEKAGYYSAEFKDARKTLADMRAAKRQARLKRSGNFDEVDGRMIYRPN